MARTDDILDYWFGPADGPEYGTKRDFWFNSGAGSGPDTDAEINRRFLAEYERGVAGAYDGWAGATMSCLALVLLFDQFPRNMFRGEARAYATDRRARDMAVAAIDRGDLERLLEVQQSFLFLPLEHSEDIADQRRCLALNETLSDGEYRTNGIRHAIEHMEIIERFGRFPHRNAILGRESTPGELEYLTENGDLHFGTRKWEDR